MSTRRRASASTATTDAVRAFMNGTPHRVAVLIFPGAAGYEAAAAAEVFSTANNQLMRDFGINRDAYTFEIIGSQPGPLKLEMGLQILCDSTMAQTGRAPGEGIDTLLVSGACWEPMESALANPALVDWIKRASTRVNRVAAMCSGSFLLAEAGVIDGPTTTHWAHCERLRARYPHLDVRDDNIFVKAGKFYSSAGSTAAMDMILALVEEDLGHKVAMAVARRLVMFLKRPGGQSQFSEALRAQTAPQDVLGGVPEWIVNHLGDDLSVEKLAARAGMSPRNFARVFLAEIGITPARYVEQARIEKARMLMEETRLSLGAIAGKAGFENDRQMRRAFMRWLKVMPSDYLARFRGGAADNAYIAKTAKEPRKSTGRKAPLAREEAPWR